MTDSIYIIAEAGVNHNGSLAQAKELVDVAATAGADAVKFQTFTAETLVSSSLSKAEYQIAATGSQESQYQMIKRLELSVEAHETLAAHCRERGIEFLSTPFDLDSLGLLVHQFNLSRLKISSGDIGNGPLLLAAARTGKPVILSTGMSSLGEVELALGVLAFGYSGNVGVPSMATFREAYGSVECRRRMQQKVTLLHCTTEYPAPLPDVNLRAMNTLSHAFGTSVGYSDHTQGITIPVAAAALGATIIEKHFTLSRDLPGPDHQASLEPSELEWMVKAIRQVELALGSATKYPAAIELKNMFVARKVIVAAENIQKGELFTEKNITAKRAGEGTSPLYHWDVIGKIADRDYQQNDRVEF